MGKKRTSQPATFAVKVLERLVQRLTQLGVLNVDAPHAGATALCASSQLLLCSRKTGKCDLHISAAYTHAHPLCRERLAQQMDPRLFKCTRRRAQKQRKRIVKQSVVVRAKVVGESNARVVALEDSETVGEL